MRFMICNVGRDLSMEHVTYMKEGKEYSNKMYIVPEGWLIYSFFSDGGEDFVILTKGN